MLGDAMRLRRALPLSLLFAASLALGAGAQTAIPDLDPESVPGFGEGPIAPDLSGNDSHWIRDPDSGCVAANPAPVEGESISWSGPCVDGLIAGRGTLTWYEGGRIKAHDVGVFARGALTGHGLIEHIDGTRYEGDFPGEGTLSFPDGTMFRARTLWNGYGWAIEALVPSEGG